MIWTPYFCPGPDLGAQGPRPPTNRGPPTNSVQVNQLQKNSTKDAPKLAFLSSKIEKFSGERAQTPPQTSPPAEGDPLPTPYPLSAFGASILAPTALDLGLRGDCQGSYGLLATPLLQRSTRN